MNDADGKAEKLLQEISRKVGGRELSYCLQCTTCNTCCPVRGFSKALNPKELVHALLTEAADPKKQVQGLYRCLLCGFCQEACPIGLRINDMMTALREKLVSEGAGPLPQHKLVRRDQEWSTSDSVTLASCDTAEGRCERLFFPGCGLSGYSPELVVRVYDYLSEKLPGTGILLGCCGAPTHFLGDRSRFSEILTGVESRMEGLGATELIVACPDCYHTIKSDRGAIRVRAITEVILEHGLPHNVMPRSGTTFSVHDSCKARWEPVWQESVRALVRQMGHAIDEMAHSKEKTSCCGVGGMLPYVDLELASKLIKARAEEASYDILTYCASCRETLASCKPALHVLDLVFRDDWEEARTQEPKTGKARRDNQARLRTMILERSSQRGL